MTRFVTDQTGRKVSVPDVPRRIISLCPSETETLAALVSPGRLAGCTRFCKYPAGLVPDLPKIGGTKQLDFDAISATRPDLLIAVKEENDKDEINALADIYPLIILDPVDHPTTHESIRIMGRAVGESAKAESLVRDIQTAIDGFPSAHGRRALYLIWRKPYMTVGKGTFINAMMESVGLVNAGAELEGRYPALDEPAIERAAPEIILAASEPFPFSEKHRRELEDRFPNCRIFLVDGEAFGWHGVRTPEVSDILTRLVREILDEG